MTVLLSRTPGRSHDREEISPGYALIVYLVKIVFAIMARPGTGEADGRGRQGTWLVTGLLLPGAGGAGPGGWHANRAHRAGAPITPGTQSCDSLVYALIVYKLKIVFVITAWPGMGEAGGRGRWGA